MKRLISTEHLATDTADAIYARHKVPGTREHIRHDVDVLKVVYLTRDTDGTEIRVSGSLLVPVGVKNPRTMCYYRGTIVPVEGETAAPSHYETKEHDKVDALHYEMSFLAPTFASAGYLVIAPDGIGYGVSKDREHPYLHASSLATTALDMLRAVREVRPEMSPKIYLTGWSEGGLGGMALHQLIQERHGDEFSVAASSLLAGTYALSAQIHLFCSYDEDYPEHQTNYWKLRVMCRVYNLARPFNRTLREPYATNLMKDVLGDAPKNPRLALDPDFRETFLRDAEPGMEAALRDNDRYDWAPKAPVYLHHGTGDDIVPFFCAQMAYESMRRKGCDVHLVPYLAQNHYQPAPAYVVRTLDAFGR